MRQDGIDGLGSCLIEGRLNPGGTRGLIGQQMARHVENGDPHGLEKARGNVVPLPVDRDPLLDVVVVVIPRLDDGDAHLVDVGGLAVSHRVDVDRGRASRSF